MSRKQNGIVKTLLGWPLLLAGGWMAYSKWFVDHNAFLPNAIPEAEWELLQSENAGKLNIYHRSHPQGRPLLLIHSVNAAASAYEMGPLFRHYVGLRPVYALDLPGYGFSDRAPRAYTPALFQHAIIDVLHQIGAPADVVALSLGCEFAAAAALARPELFHSLVCISPSGLNAQNTGRATQQASMRGSSDRLYQFLAFPLWARPLFDLIASRRSIRFFLRQSFVDDITPGFVDYAYATSHQPGAEHAPLAFLSGKLFTQDVCGQVYEKLDTPALIIYDEDAYSRFDRLPELLQRNPRWRATRIVPSRGLPHFEKLSETVGALDHFWEGLGDEA